MEQEIIAQIPGIILKEMNREASSEEISILKEWLEQSEENKKLYLKLRRKDNLASIVKEYNNINGILAWEKLIQKMDGRLRFGRKQFMLKILKYAAILAVPLGIAVYFLNQPTARNISQETFTELNKQLSELKESSLILANGEVINLQEKQHEPIVEIDGTKIAKEDSTLSYKNQVSEVGKEIQYNSLVAPKSKVFSVVLADGTKVWLNASSAIKYPTQFTSGIRQVFLTGEAYFEVTRDPNRPFIVSTSNMEIEVLGTCFNVMAYSDEKYIVTTLVSGEVKVKTAQSKLILKPGMKAELNKETEQLQQTETNTQQVTSWHLGKYIFEYEDLESVISKLAKWYDIKVVYINKEKKSLHFSGTLNKYNDINETLHIIELTTKVKFTFSGDTLLVK